MTLFKNKYRIETTRLKHWDYSSDGEYFVTICTKNRMEYFGEIRNGIMGLNEMGNAAAICWQNIPSHFPFTELGAWVVMPNHVHGVIIINNVNPNPRKDAINRVFTGNGNGGITGKYNPMGKNTLGEIIRWLKGQTTFEIRKNINLGFGWISRFYDHIIFGEKESEEIYNYILNNPWKWEQDRNKPENLWM